jgi:MerR family transcriptional regulator, thiopeptide resistance regulator
MSGTPRIIPVLVYQDIEAGHDYLVNVFGFTSGGLHRLDDRTVIHGEVTLGDFAIWLHAVSRDAEMASPRNSDVSHSGLSVHIPDVDRHYQRVKAAGARIEYEPTDKPYGLREYGVRDPDGHRWWFSTPLTSV